MLVGSRVRLQNLDLALGLLLERRRLSFEILYDEQAVPPGTEVLLSIASKDVFFVETQKGEILECLFDPTSSRILVDAALDFDDQVLVVAVLGNDLEDDHVQSSCVSEETPCFTRGGIAFVRVSTRPATTPWCPTLRRPRAGCTWAPPVASVSTEPVCWLPVKAARNVPRRLCPLVR